MARTRYCTSISADSLEEMVQKTDHAFYFGTDLVEFRIDRLMSRVTSAEIVAKLEKYAPRAVVTVRPSKEGGGFTGSEIERLGLLDSLARMRPAYIDVELSAAKENQRWFEGLPRRVERIISWHDLRGTPEAPELERVCEEELERGAIAKVVTTATTMEDNLRTLGLCAKHPGKAVSFCMGELGAPSRLLSMLLHAPLVYASLPHEAVAPGQISISTMREFRGLMEKR